MEFIQFSYPNRGDHASVSEADDGDQCRAKSERRSLTRRYQLREMPHPRTRHYLQRSAGS